MKNEITKPENTDISNSDFSLKREITKKIVENAPAIMENVLSSMNTAIQSSKELEIVKQQFQQTNKLIDEEYKKQHKAMDKASEVVDAGLKDNDFNKIALGLGSMTNIANHNPFENLQKNIKKTKKDDDFIIEI